MYGHVRVESNPLSTPIASFWTTPVFVVSFGGPKPVHGHKGPSRPTKNRLEDSHRTSFDLYDDDSGVGLRTKIVCSTVRRVESMSPWTPRDPLLENFSLLHVHVTSLSTVYLLPRGPSPLQSTVQRPEQKAGKAGKETRARAPNGVAKKEPSSFFFFFMLFRPLDVPPIR